MNREIVCLSCLFINVVAVFMFLEALVESLDEGDFKRFEGQFEDFVAEALEGVDVEVVEFSGFVDKAVVQVGR